jgi:deazaflavin-dependent oxidoreductase (nitroreductase family)
VDDRVRQALANDRVVDITTTGRTSGLPRRIETWFYRVGERYYLSGAPGRRDWYANLLATPEFTFHLKQSAVADLPARAVPVVDRDQRREILSDILWQIGQTDNLERWVAESPLAEVTYSHNASRK